MPWVLAYMIAYFFQGGSGGGAVGLISNLRSYLWIPISQNSYRCASGQGGQACPLACAWVIAVRPPLVPIPLRKFHTYSCAFPSCLYFLLSVPLPPPGGRL